MKKISTIIEYTCDHCHKENVSQVYYGHKLIPVVYDDWNPREKPELDFCSKDCFKKFVGKL